MVEPTANQAFRKKLGDIELEPEEMLAEYRARVAGIAERAQAARQQIAAVRGTETSSDGAVTVSVNASGALEDLSFGSAADSIPLAELAKTILRTCRKARIRAATAGADALAPLIGANSAAMDQVRAAIPDGDSLDEDADRPSRDGLNEEDSGHEPTPITRPASVPPRPHIVDDDDLGTGYTRGD